LALVSFGAKGHDALYHALLPDSVDVFYDQDLSMSEGGIIALEPENFVRKDIDGLNFNFSNSAIWFRFKVKNAGEKLVKKFLWIENADIHTIELFVYNEGELLDKQVAGKSIAISKRRARDPTPVFSVELPAQSTRVFVLKVYKIGGSLSFPVRLLSENDYYRLDKKVSNVFTLMLGLLLFAVFFNIFLFFILGDQIYLTYSLYVLFSFLSIGGLTGYFNLYIWPEFTWLSIRETVLFNFPGTILLLLFFQEYLDLKKTVPKSTVFITYTLYVLYVGFFLSLLSLPFVGIAILLSNITTLWCFVFVVVVALYARKKMKVYATYVLVSYLPMLLVVISVFFRNAGVLNISYTGIYLTVSLAFQVATLAFALIDKFKRMQAATFNEIQDKNEQLLKLNLAVHETDNSIAYYSRYGDIEWCNHGLENLFGLPLPEIKDRYGSHITDINLNSKIGEFYRKCGETKEPIVFETEYVDNVQNEKKWMQTTLTPVLDSNKDICNYITIDTDLTASKQSEEEKKQLQAQLLQSQKMETVGKLAGGIAHDFNNILTPIIGYTDMAIQDLPQNSYIKDDLNIVLNAAQRAKKLVSQILTFSRHFKEESTFVHVKDIVDEAIVLLSSTIPTNISILFSNQAQRDLIFADPTQIQQVIMNLCTNAYQAIGDKNGYVSISLDNVRVSGVDKKPKLSRLTSGEYLLLSVQDSGHGMDKDTLAQLFDPFFTTKEVGKGTGLGLSVVHGIVIKYQGEILFESEQGTGTVAQVYLPVADGNEQATTYENVHDNEPTWGNSESILIVDDEKSISEMLGKVLKKHGYRPTCCTSSTNALYRYAQSPQSFDLVIADQTMPEKTGSELSKEILRINPYAKIIVLTGYSEFLNADIAESIGIKGLLYKPVNMQMLVNKVKMVIRD